MTTAAIVMMCIGIGCTWGGAIYCIRRAMQSKQA
ncbi:hypothetical protein VST7929_01138 [Vibrio stylophorae]|uniref:MetS family NSS transporter small subunit n=1 Tax=Vibrio stylophorae TaxID=659351 RepID=A0ABM8ZSI8_9VIBR|nr:MetS family NSS transporter small subunit [Vibrio stylophorae]CAH0533274.1 hypothetical protein VST7929_01138 [Vibrio stylophorae]